MKALRYLLGSLVFAAIAGCGGGGGSNEATISFTNPDGSSSPVVSVEIADSATERSMGLMYRKELNPEAGMLFLFPEEQLQSFWMRNTYLELDMIFMDAGFRVVSIVERAVPLTETPRVSEKPAKYVLEVLGGSARQWGIVPGSIGKTGSLPAPR